MPSSRVCSRLAFASLDKGLRLLLPGSRRLALWSCFGSPPSGPGACLGTGRGAFNYTVSTSWLILQMAAVNRFGARLGALCQPSAVCGETPSVGSFLGNQGGSGQVALSPRTPQNQAPSPRPLNSHSYADGYASSRRVRSQVEGETLRRQRGCSSLHRDAGCGTCACPPVPPQQSWETRGGPPRPTVAGVPALPPTGA